MSRKNKSSDGGTDLLDKEDIKVRKPNKYKVVFHNDDYTPMDFVLALLMEVFRKPFSESYNIMMTVHQKGKGIAGVYSKEIAETKSVRSNDISRSSGHPLLVTIEEE